MLHLPPPLDEKLSPQFKIQAIDRGCCAWSSPSMLSWQRRVLQLLYANYCQPFFFFPFFTFSIRIMIIKKKNSSQRSKNIYLIYYDFLISQTKTHWYIYPLNFLLYYSIWFFFFLWGVRATDWCEGERRKWRSPFWKKSMYIQDCHSRKSCLFPPPSILSITFTINCTKLLT